MRATRSLGKLVLAGSMAAAAMGLFSLPASAAAPLCDQRVFQEFWCGDNPFVSLPYKSICWQYWYCGDGKPAGRTPSGCDFICDLDTYVRHTRPAEPCPEHQGSDERCGNGLDDDWDGCVDEDCTIGEPPCTCTGRCDEPACSPPPHSTCDPFRPNEPEICGNGEDDNCSGQVDEGCWPKRECQANVGSDPIVLASRAAVTTPFADFSVTAVSRLSLTRIYSSADASIVGGAAPGPFGRGWHHEWEASLSCREGVCTVRRGLETGLRYGGAGSARSLDGTETWDIYRAYADETGMKYDAPGVLARRPTGEWILFGADGGEQHFQTVCDACDGADLASPRCLDPLLGGTARLVKVVDAAGNAVHLGYDRPSGLLFGLFDDLGHALEARSATACADGLARELRYDGSPVAAYEYDGVDLVRASDADGSTLRAYAYHPGSGGRLQAVLDEARTAVAEFGYDAAWRATGIIDGESSAAVDYDAPGGAAVTEFFQGEAGPTTATSLRQLDRNGNVVSVSDGCACGAPRTYAYTDGRMTCSADAQGGVVGQEFDAEGRLTRRVEYSGSCPVPSSLPLPSRDERRAYGVTRTVAEGILVDLDRVTGVTRKSRLYTSGIAEESFDYDPAPKAIDPAGYACTEAPLPAGSVVCRRIESGYVTVGSSKVLERHATFLSYDGRGRLVRSVGPLNLDRPSASDVTPVEERTYWADTDLLQRRGRLREVKRYETPEGAPLVTSYDHDAFGVYQAREPDGATTTYVKDGRGRVRFVLEAGGQTETRYHAGSDPRVVVGPSGATT